MTDMSPADAKAITDNMPSVEEIEQELARLDRQRAALRRLLKLRKELEGD